MGHQSPAKSKPRPPVTPPLISAENLAAQIWALAGISTQDRANALQKAFNSALADLQATKIEFVRDSETRSHNPVEIPDNVARAKARDQLFRVVIPDSAPSGTPKLELTLPPWAQVTIGKPAQPVDKPDITEINPLPSAPQADGHSGDK